MLRSKHFKDLGWKKNIARLIVSWIAWQVAAVIVAYLIGTIVGIVGLIRGIPPAIIEGTSLFILNAVSYIVGAYLAWKFIWNNKRWGKAPENDLDTTVDVE